MHIKKFLFCLGAIAVLLVSCDRDYNELGSDILGGENYQLGTRHDFNVTASTFATGAVQSNNLATNPLGVYTDPVFGKVTANFVTQVALATEAPTIGTDPEIDDVILKIPYTSTATGETDSDGNNAYTINSLYTRGTGKFNLEIYRNGYFLRDNEVDGSNEITSQYYYTDQNQDIDNVKVGSKLNDLETTDHEENTAFFFNPKEIVTNEYADDGVTVTNTTREAPAMIIHLNKEYFAEAILNTNSANLASNNAFKEYFRGLYFKATGNNDDEALNLLNFTAGTITISYTAGETEDTRTDRTITLNLTGTTISLQERQNAFAVPQGRLAVLGGPGYTSQIDILNPSDLEMMRNEKWMINEASLSFYVDESITGMQHADHTNPQRIYLYDMNHKQAVLDYLYDNTTLSDASLNKYVYGGIYLKDSLSPTVIRHKYKIRLTNYLRSLISDDSTNVRLGLAVSQSIANSTMNRRKSGAPDFSEGSDFIPQASVISPLGTVLYGADATDETTRLKLTVYYTIPNP
ncbi:DUF4270 domain-containing protein [Flavobacterium silvaticum]|uniref:DUF4270 domain-containing protein n=1 Tax=Flavobacterium silvaticum TaxID=1852020 RepID=A0A972G0J7_9FLAO|nr:DUF4270 domain-containing protein [Flavobacterium silvaticum]NMH28221.1 DUF4270 domain-containing protein [Flavobacterium silvaticum]